MSSIRETPVPAVSKTLFRIRNLLQERPQLTVLRTLSDLGQRAECFFCVERATVAFEGDYFCNEHAGDMLSQRLTNLVNVALGKA